METSDGDSRLIEPGQVLFHEDTWGRGHRESEVDGGSYDLMLVPVAEGVSAVGSSTESG